MLHLLLLRKTETKRVARIPVIFDPRSVTGVLLLHNKTPLKKNECSHNLRKLVIFWNAYYFCSKRFRSKEFLIYFGLLINIEFFRYAETQNVTFDWFRGF